MAAHSVKAARIVGDGVAVGVRPDAVLVVVAHGVRLLRSWRVCAHLSGLKRSVRVGLCASLTPYIYIYNRRKQIILMKKQKIICFCLVI